ncbi:MAG: response regulator, partial [Chitinophagaceae bacterium]
MNKNGTIVIIEDDKEDQQLLEEIFATLNHPNKVLYFSDGME